jgi:hypothetical protein
MKRLLIVIAATTLLAAACNDDDPAAPTDNPTPHPYSGTFDVDFALRASDCNSPPPLDVLESVTINGDDFDWDGVEGTWDEENKTAQGTSAETCIPIPPPTGCVGCYVMEYNLTFASPDSFYGELTVPYTYSVECNATDCSSIYDVTGVRVK